MSTADFTVVLIAVLIATFTSAGLALFVGLHLGKQRVRRQVIAHVDHVLAMEKLVAETNVMSPKQRNEALISNIENLRKEVQQA